MDSYEEDAVIPCSPLTTEWKICSDAGVLADKSLKTLSTVLTKAGVLPAPVCYYFVCNMPRNCERWM